MRLITIENYELKVTDEALLVRPIRRLFNMDRSKGKENFYKQMSILYFVYSPASNYAYITDEKERLQEVLEQEGIKEFHASSEFKAAVEAYKKLSVTSSSALLESLRKLINNMRKALDRLKFEGEDEKELINNIKNAAAVTAMLPKVIKDVVETEKSVIKELEEKSNTRGSQELTILDSDMD